MVKEGTKHIEIVWTEIARKYIAKLTLKMDVSHDTK